MIGKLLTEEVNLFQKLPLFISLGLVLKNLVVLGCMSVIVFEKKVWYKDINLTRRNVRPQRNYELQRTDYFMLIDAPITEEQRKIAIEYRQKLRDVPNHENIEEIVMPECPDFMKEKVY